MKLPILAALLASMLAAEPKVTVRLYWQHPGHPQSRTIEMPREEYVAGVLAGEASVFRSEEALKAMAVVARTYAFRFLGRHRDEGFDFCDATHCQDLRLEALSERLRRAAEATEDELLWYEGSAIAAFYHRHCGGVTEAVGEVWPDLKAPYLRQLQDTYCIAQDRAEWSAAIAGRDLRSALEREGVRLPEGDSSLEILGRTPSRRVKRLAIAGRPVSAYVLHHAIGRALGWHLLRSSFYEVRASGGEFVFRGYGAGHGVGLCQAGADRRGVAGHTYRQILAFYYPTTVPGVSAQGFSWELLGGERADVFTTRPGADRVLVALADRLLPEAERRSGLRYAGRARVRVYPSVAAFRDATGEPGWVAASTAGRTIRLQPVEALRGALEETLLHELLHLVLESHAHPSAPDWLREGLAMHFASPGAANPASGGHRRFHEQSRARVRALIAQHGLAAVTGWLRNGLPAHLADHGGKR